MYTTSPPPLHIRIISMLHFICLQLSPMYTVPQNRVLSIKNPHYLHTCQPCIVTHVSCAVTTTTHRPKTNRVVLEEAQLIKKSPLLQNSSRSPIIDDPSLQSTWTHRAWLASGCTSVFVCLAKSAVNSIDANLLLEPVLAGLLGYLLADLGSGVYHWAIDNYGDTSTAVFGSQIEAFQGHHKWPWTITRRQFANNLHALARVITFIVVPIDIAVNDPVLLSFVALCSGCIMFSQQFHAWAHGTKSKLPPVVVALQESGVLVSSSQHSAHHRQPYNNNYCIVSGSWNKILDENMVFEALELVFFFKFGVKPRSWAEASSDWTEETEANLSQNL